MSAHLSAAQIKARLDHPIIDADGHWIEYGPVFIEELRRVGGEDAAEWREIGDWPPPGTAPQRWYLGARGSLSTAEPAADGSSSRSLRLVESSIRFCSFSCFFCALARLRSARCWL